MMKVGFVEVIYGSPKGHSYVNRDVLKILMERGHETHMLRISPCILTDDFPKPASSLDFNNGAVVPKKIFEYWLDEVHPDICFFNEYAQWWDEDHDKVLICKERGIPTIGYLVWEKLDFDKKEHYKNYTKIICPTEFQHKLMRKKGIYNTVYIPWGIDFDEIETVKYERSNDEKIIFYHCAGSGGVDDRKNTKAVIAAYSKIEDDNTELIITHIGAKTLTRNDILAFMKCSDVLVNTSKWDTLGLNTLEANACGIPVLVCDAKPMNELVKDKINGMLVSGVENASRNVTCPSCEVDVEDLAKKMSILKNTMILDSLKKSSLKYAQTYFDWKKNKDSIVKVFEAPT
jgi:glycosyltransferase involved in cell wall biosynthesis